MTDLAQITMRDPRATGRPQEPVMDVAGGLHGRGRLTRFPHIFLGCRSD